MTMEAFERGPDIDVEKLGEDFAEIAAQRHYPEIEILAQQTRASVTDLTRAFDVALNKLRDKHHLNNATEEYEYLLLARERMFNLRNGHLGPEIRGE